MRWIAPSIVALALVFSTGGVAFVGRADSVTATTPATVQSRSATKENATQCAVPTKPRNSTATHRKRTAALDTRKNTIVLNTSGYNYPANGQWEESPAEPPQGAPNGVLPMTPAPAAPVSK